MKISDAFMGHLVSGGFEINHKVFNNEVLLVLMETCFCAISCWGLGKVSHILFVEKIPYLFLVRAMVMIQPAQI